MSKAAAGPNGDDEGVACGATSGDRVHSTAIVNLRVTASKRGGARRAPRAEGR